jgi:putative SOS response-associated peptidase YedK
MAPLCVSDSESQRISLSEAGGRVAQAALGDSVKIESMCGRYTLITDAEVAKRYEKPIIGGYAVNPRYNVAPGQYAPVITAAGICQMRWGLVPAWAKDVNIGYRMINARAETLIDRPSFRGLLKANRCLVPASGFYEWKATATGKEPYYISVKGESLISFAGLYTERLDGEGVPLRTFTIITTQPNRLVAQVHNRMPVVLARADEAKWLGEGPVGTGEVLRLLRPYPARAMGMYAVDTAVNRASVDSPELIRRRRDRGR